MTEPLKAAAPHTAYPPGIIGESFPPYRTPFGNLFNLINNIKLIFPVLNCTYRKCIPSPTILPSDAPILNTGMKIPEGTGMVDVIIEKKN